LVDVLTTEPRRQHRHLDTVRFVCRIKTPRYLVAAVSSCQSLFIVEYVVNFDTVVSEKQIQSNSISHWKLAIIATLTTLQRKKLIRCSAYPNFANLTVA